MTLHNDGGAKDADDFAPFRLQEGKKFLQDPGLCPSPIWYVHDIVTEFESSCQGHEGSSFWEKAEVKTVNQLSEVRFFTFL